MQELLAGGRALQGAINAAIESLARGLALELAPRHIAQAILLAATNRFMTGATVLVDGGDALA